jgi:RNA polymerase sigma-70 factor (ECF subfamily)
MKKDKLKAFNDIYARYYRKCFLFARSYVHNEEVANDFAADAMMKLWENFDVADDILNMQAYLLTIIKNLSINYLRREKLKLTAHESILTSTQRELEFRISTLESCNPDVLFSEEVKSIFENTIASLPEKTKNIFIMSRMEDMSVKAIARELGISIKGVDYHISKALKELRLTLRDYLPAVLFLLY